METPLNYHDAVLYRRDIKNFGDGNWLNDSCINFCLRYFEFYEFVLKPFLLFMDPSVVSYIKLQHIDEDDIQSIRRGQRLRSRTHWSVLLVDGTTGQSYHFDSHTPTNEHAAMFTHDRLKVLFDWPSCEELNPIEVRTPQQLNGYDCGVYMILIARFIADQLESELSILDVTTLSHRLQALLTPQMCTDFRQGIVEVIENMYSEGR